jgi:hypothetical protein
MKTSISCRMTIHVGVNGPKLTTLAAKSAFACSLLMSSSACSIVRLSEKGSLSAIERNLERGVDPDRWDKHDRTALGAAIQGGHVDVAQALLDAGADPNKHTMLVGKNFFTTSSTPLVATIRLMEAWSPEQGAEEFSQLAIAEALIEHGADVNAGWNEGWPPLFESILCLSKSTSTSCHKLAVRLLEEGADVNAKFGELTVLDFALRSDLSLHPDLSMDLALRIIALGGEGDRDAALLHVVELTQSAHEFVENPTISVHVRHNLKQANAIIEESGRRARF